jgi:hypothetical protein
MTKTTKAKTELKWVHCEWCEVEVPAVRLWAHKIKRHQEEIHFLNIQAQQTKEKKPTED